MPYVLVLISVCAFAGISFAQNRTIKAGGNFVGVILINNLPMGALLMLWCLGTLNLREISIHNWCFIGITNLLWSVAAFYRTKSYNDIDASMAGIVGTFKLILFTCAGVLIFQEKITIYNLTGIVITAAAILYTIDFKSVTVTRGARQCLIGAVFGAAAIVMSKYLSTQVPTVLIVASDFFLPGLFIWLYVRNPAGAVTSAFRANRTAMLLVPVFSISAYYLYITAFSMGGQLVIVSILQQTGLIMVLGIEYLFLRVVPNFPRRCLAGALCTLGAVLVTAF